MVRRMLALLLSVVLFAGCSAIFNDTGGQIH
jgi:uncharacterized protein YceK